MDRASFEFHLTGSRFFGYEQPGSDWDYFVENQSGLEDWLTTSGFCKESESSYLSAEVYMIWKHESFPIHVQVVNDARLKSAVQEALRDSGCGHELHQTSRENRTALWNIAFAMFRAGTSSAWQPTPSLP